MSSPRWAAPWRRAAALGEASLLAGAGRTHRGRVPDGGPAAGVCQQAGPGDCSTRSRNRRRAEPPHLQGSGVADPGLLGPVWGRSAGRDGGLWALQSWERAQEPALTSFFPPGWDELDFQSDHQQEEVRAAKCQTGLSCRSLRHSQPLWSLGCPRALAGP